jgi:large subunit ribosomal protein L13
MNKTYMPSREDALAARKWQLVDAQGEIVGRLATKIASILRGKNKATFTPHEDTGDFVVVINCSGMRWTGAKAETKLYRRHTGYPGGVRTRTAADEMQTHPERVLKHAVVGMLPKNRLGRQLATKIKIYRGAEHPHQAQQPSIV